MELSQIKYTDLKKLKKEYDMKALLPVGSLEQHGPHLPLGTDAIICNEVCKAAAENRNDVLLLPLCPYGQSEHHMGFPGTITVRHETIINIIKNIGESLYRHDIKRFIVANGHGGNTHAIAAGVYELNAEKPEMEVSHVDVCNFAPKDFKYEFLSEKAGRHANDYETSVMLFLNPNLVDMSKACKEFPSKKAPSKTSKRTIVDFKKYSISGVWGDPRSATAVKGKEYFDIMVSELTKVIDS